MDQASKVPSKAWVVTFAGMSVNLCLGIIYAWSVWKAVLVATKDHPAGSPMTGLNAGWSYLTDAQATWAYVSCGMIFAAVMILGGRLQDRYGPRLGVTLGGLFLACGCIIAGVSKSYAGLLVGFGLMGGIGMGLGYSATTPAAVKWFGPHRRGMIVGLVVGGYGAAAIYISPLAKALIARYGLSGSFIGLGLFFASVVLIASRLISAPPKGYVPSGRPTPGEERSGVTRSDWTTREMVGTWQFLAIFVLSAASAQTGLLVIANATPILLQTAGPQSFFADNAWIMASFAGCFNAGGRIGTGIYSDKIGRANAYMINGLVSAACVFLLPTVIVSGSVPLLFLVVAVACWQFGGGLSLMPAFTADYFGPKNLGLNYGLIFLGWGFGFLMPQVAGYVKDATGRLDSVFYASATFLVAAVILSRLIRRPLTAAERLATQPTLAVAG